MKYSFIIVALLAVTSAHKLSMTDDATPKAEANEEKAAAK